MGKLIRIHNENPLLVCASTVYININLISSIEKYDMYYLIYMNTGKVYRVNVKNVEDIAELIKED